MLVSYGTTIPLLIAVLWAFFYFSPKSANKRKLITFNVSTLVLAITASLMLVLYLKHSMEGGSDFGWWPVVSFLNSLVLSSIIIGLLGIVRNFIVFRKHEST